MRDYGNAHITYHLVHSGVLPKKGFPIVFHGVKASEQGTKWSPSYFNILEASIVRDYCVKLIRDPERKICESRTVFVSVTFVDLGVDPEEIAVLAPYKAQVRAIRELLKVAKLSDIHVGPVEQFQGQVRCIFLSRHRTVPNCSDKERKVIILATTRSNEENHPQTALGSLLNRQRTNGWSFVFPPTQLTYG